MIHLLDVNVLISLCDPAHPHEASARRFFRSGLARDGWATCPLVENGFLRVFGSYKYPGGPGTPHAARLILTGLLSTPGHQFWPDEISIMDAKNFPNLPNSNDLTDLYLLALASRRGGRFATFDQNIPAHLMPGGPDSLLLIPHF